MEWIKKKRGGVKEWGEKKGQHKYKIFAQSFFIFVMLLHRVQIYLYFYFMLIVWLKKVHTKEGDVNFQLALLENGMEMYFLYLGIYFYTFLFLFVCSFIFLFVLFYFLQLLYKFYIYFLFSVISIGKWWRVGEELLCERDWVGDSC